MSHPQPHPTDLRRLISRRYGLPAPPVDPVGETAAAYQRADRLAEAIAAAPEPAQAVLRTQLDHRSVRAFLPDPVDEQVVPTLVAAAQSAPTSSNLQAWSVVAVTDPDRKARLAHLAGDQRHITQAPLLLVWVADLARARALGADTGQELAATDYLESTIVAFLDAALAAQNAVVAAEALGLGTVYVGALRNHPEQVADELALPPGSVAVAGLVVGHPDPAVPSTVKPRLPQAAVLHHEQYDPSTQTDQVGIYQDRIDAFYRDANLIGNWADRVVTRLHGPASLNGRDRLRDALTARGLQSR